MNGHSRWQARTLRLFQSLLVVFAAFVAAGAFVPPLAGVLVDAGVVAAGGTGYDLVRTVLQFSAFVLAVLAYLAAGDDWELVGYRLPTRREWLFVAGGVVVLLVGQLGFLVALDALGIGAGENRAIAGDYEPVYYLAMVPLSLLVVGPAEELLFRGAVQGLLRRAWGAWPAIAIATAVFGLVHFTGVSGTGLERLAYVVIAALLGGVLGYLYERTRNVVVPALVHGAYNAVLFGVQYGVVTGLL